MTGIASGIDLRFTSGAAAPAPDSCARFLIRAGISRFVRAIPDSCWNFPIRARHSRFVRATPD
jgi:hypothetical protein